MEQMHARRLLSHAAATVIPSPGPVDDGAVPRAAPFSSVDSTVIMILSLLLCVLIVALVLHAFVRCAFRVTRHVCHGQEPPGGEASAAPPAGKRTKGGALPTVEYCSNVELAVCSSTECAICLAEFRQGERVRVLPRCNHGFHARCIGRWLAKRQTCPTCRRDPFAQPAPAPAAVQLQVHADAGQQWTTSLTVQC